ncbi:MAG: hypothetical protein E6H97_00760 [Chloroflexi bacterium]|nr:MAG: hypothetical protein E6H97_00760 [Chloroflexota bacterium]
MTLRDDMHDYFERESLRLPVPAALRADVTVRAAQAPVPSVRWAAAIAVVLAAAIIAGLVAAGRLRQEQSPAVPAGVPVGSGQMKVVLDADLVDPLRGWALLGVCERANNQCRAWVESTADGGRSWGGAVTVGPKFDGGDGDSPRHIHFASMADGFVYGLGNAYATHDGGKTWSQMPRELQPDRVVAFGRSGLLLAGPGKGDMAITGDGGRSWRSIAGRCALDNPGNSVATADGTEIWQVCGAQTLGINVTTDGGAHWVSRQNPGVGNLVGPFVVSPKLGMALLIASTTEAGIVSELLVSQDRGASWKSVPGAKGFGAIVFCETGEAWTSDGYGNIWASADDGLNWTKLPSKP